MNAKMKSRNMRNFKQFPRTSPRVDEIRHWWVTLDLGQWIKGAVAVCDTGYSKCNPRWVYLEN